MSGDWSGKVVLIAGGAGGIGRAAAEEFRRAGAQVAIADLNISDLPGGCSAISADLRNTADCARMVAETVRRHGRLDLLVNAAGIWVSGPADTMSEAQWDRVMDVNLKGTFFASRFAIPELEKTQGHIINIASDAGLMGNSGAAIYCASKGGVVLLTKALALELAPRGIRVNAVCPCDVETPMLAGEAEASGNPEAYRAKLRGYYPQGPRTRFATADEIAAFIFMIASPRLAPLTGAALSIDFGTTAGK